ncbi:hypothetical protein BO99DRAFT_146929 [Aspergillus violaceofuscus CBS 115571]|uniref:Uncharacterized protein n=1 Tax=Aspergillus violaceofuscus (strain CBS 115571) TaxID=1450538 RepID=A0A2V5IHF7_ASPV1|nr:hypothetical protein BO99DRAFT_146929 [Aspergillus violaceofuscus CBS 115571]
MSTRKTFEMSPRGNGNGNGNSPPTPRIIIVPASPPTTSSPTTDSEEDEHFSPMSISPTSPRATLIAPPRRFRRLLPAPAPAARYPQPLSRPLSLSLSQPQEDQQQQQPLSPAFPPMGPFQIHPFIPSPPSSPPPKGSPPPYSPHPTTEPPLKRLKPNPHPHLLSPKHNPFIPAPPAPKPLRLPKNPRLAAKLTPLLTHLCTPLHPLVSSTTGHYHPAFPRTLLAFHCLTHAQLDSLARHFHQVYPAVAATGYYPITVPPWLGIPGAEGVEVDLETKRRRFGRFIGLRGCESPTSLGDYQGSEAEREEGDGDGGRNAWVEMAERRRRVRGWLERLDIDSSFGGPGEDGQGAGEEGEVEEQQQQGHGSRSGEVDPVDTETPEEMLARMAREWDAAMERAKWDSNFALRWKMGG